MENEMRLSQLHVHEVRRPAIEPACVPRDCSVARLVQEMTEAGTSYLACVIDADSRLLGVVNIRDLTEYLFPYTAALAQGQGLLAAQPKNLQECTIDEVMQPCEPVHDEQTLDDAARLLMQSCVSEVPVVDGQQRVIGLITLHDVLVACRTALWEG